MGFYTGKVNFVIIKVYVKKLYDEQGGIEKWLVFYTFILAL